LVVFSFIFMISKLIPGMANVNLAGKIVSKDDKRSVNTKYGKSQVCDAILRDDTGEIKLTLWGEQISKVREGDEVSISGAYITEFQGELQLNVPKKGLLEVGIKE